MIRSLHLALHLLAHGSLLVKAIAIKGTAWLVLCFTLGTRSYDYLQGTMLPVLKTKYENLKKEDITIVTNEIPKNTRLPNMAPPTNPNFEQSLGGSMNIISSLERDSDPNKHDKKSMAQERSNNTLQDKAPFSLNSRARSALGEKTNIMMSPTATEAREVDLSKAMSRVNLVRQKNTCGITVSEEIRDSISEPTAPGVPELDNASKILKSFLLKHSPEFVRVNGYRERVSLR